MSKKTVVNIEGVTNFDIPNILFTERSEVENQFGDQYPQMSNMEYSYSEEEDEDTGNVTGTHTFKQKDGTKNA